MLVSLKKINMICKVYYNLKVISIYIYIFNQNQNFIKNTIYPYKKIKKNVIVCLSASIK